MYNDDEMVSGPNNTLIWGHMAVCSSPRKEKNRSKLDYEIQYTK